MRKLYFEDFKPGSVSEYGPRPITREEIVAFAAEFDPQPMHLDEDAARATMLGGLAASGWHTCSLVMRMMCDGFLLQSSSMGAGTVSRGEMARAGAAGRPADLARNRGFRARLAHPAGHGNRRNSCTSCSIRPARA